MNKPYAKGTIHAYIKMSVKFTRILCIHEKLSITTKVWQGRAINMQCESTTSSMNLS